MSGDGHWQLGVCCFETLVAQYHVVVVEGVLVPVQHVDASRAAWAEIRVPLHLHSCGAAGWGQTALPDVAANMRSASTTSTASAQSRYNALHSARMPWAATMSPDLRSRGRY